MSTALLLFLLVVQLCASLHHPQRSSLDIPKDAKNVLFIGQASHLDWDWLNDFPTNVNNTPPDHLKKQCAPYFGPSWYGTVEPTSTGIFPAAAKFLNSSSDYGYSVCEIGFLRRFQQDNPQLFSIMASHQPQFSIVGGGITSPDNLLPHGEAFFHNYLAGLNWMKNYNILWSGTVWLPDDFGHDSQLPVMLNAMNVKGVSFSRVPGSCQQSGSPATKGYVTAHQILLDKNTGGLDFYWSANDGSKTYTYYMPSHYCAGDSILNDNYKDFGSLEEAATCSAKSLPKGTNEHIQNYINVRLPVSRTPYMFLALGCDFAVPVPGLVDIANKWNTVMYPQTGVWVSSSTFSHYVEMVLAYIKEKQINLYTRNFHGADNTTSFVPTPYWTGFYATRPELKHLHYEGTRHLLGAEILNVIIRAFNLQSPVSQQQLDVIWDNHSPSTHHDYITGTSMNLVYNTEQIPISQSVLNKSTSARDMLLRTLVGYDMKTVPSLVVFNSLSFPVNGQVAIPTASIPESLRKMLHSSPSVQVGANGDTLVMATAPALGYQIYILKNITNAPPPLVRAKATLVDDDIVIENDLLKATLSRNASWSISCLASSSGQDKCIAIGNILRWRSDTGDQYRFGFERNPNGFSPLPSTVTSLDAEIIENGPLRVIVRAKLELIQTEPKNVWPYVIEYTLLAGSPYIGINVTGAVPWMCTLLTEFQFPTSIDHYDHGTAYHYDTKKPFPWGLASNFQITFEATHNFIIPRGQDKGALGAIYHGGVPAWGVIGSSLFGALLRNTPEVCNDTGQSDADVHSLHYAIRTPFSLQDPSTGQPLQEALQYNHHLQAIFTQPRQNQPPTYSMATVSPKVFITAVKRGTFDPNTIFYRLYQPTNGPLTVNLEIDSALVGSPTVKIFTALEEEISGEGKVLPMTRNGDKVVVAVETTRAVTTIGIALPK